MKHLSGRFSGNLLRYIVPRAHRHSEIAPCAGSARLSTGAAEFFLISRRTDEIRRVDDEKQKVCSVEFFSGVSFVSIFGWKNTVFKKYEIPFFYVSVDGYGRASGR